MNEKKSVLVGVKVTPSQYQRILERCEKVDITISEYLRRAAFDGEIYIVEGLPELVIQISKIGNNINQLTRQVHSYHVPDLDRKLDSVNSELQGIRMELKRLKEKAVI